MFFGSVFRSTRSRARLSCPDAVVKVTRHLAQHWLHILLRLFDRGIVFLLGHFLYRQANTKQTFL